MCKITNMKIIHSAFMLPCFIVNTSPFLSHLLPSMRLLPPDLSQALFVKSFRSPGFFSHEKKNTFSIAKIFCAPFMRLSLVEVAKLYMTTSVKSRCPTHFSWRFDHKTCRARKFYCCPSVIAKALNWVSNIRSTIFPQIVQLDAIISTKERCQGGLSRKDNLPCMEFHPECLQEGGIGHCCRSSKKPCDTHQHFCTNALSPGTGTSTYSTHLR